VSVAKALPTVFKMVTWLGTSTKKDSFEIRKTSEDFNKSGKEK